jgi:hypothetical protein
MHSFNLEKNLTGDNSLIFPLKGFIVENAVTDYRSDPSIYTMEMLYAFSLIPQSLYDAYKESECFIPWVFLWFDLKLIPYPELKCI